MAESYLRQSALDHRGLASLSAGAAGVALTVEPPAVQLCLRGRGERFRDAVREVLGVAPPTTPNEVAGQTGCRILWLGPDEWLAVGAGPDAASWAPALEAALDGIHSLVTDVSHARTVIRLEGERARWVLMKGCCVDVDPGAFGPGRCAQTALARAHVLLHQVSDAPLFHLYVQRSFTDYVYAWLEDAAR